MQVKVGVDEGNLGHRGVPSQHRLSSDAALVDSPSLTASERKVEALSMGLEAKTYRRDP
jgi:hypothetical protein